MSAKKNTKKPFTLLESEVASGYDGSTRSGRNSGKLSRQSRSMDLRSGREILHHIPTGLTVSAPIKENNYTRKQMQAERARLKALLMVELEKLVVKHYQSKGHAKFG